MKFTESWLYLSVCVTNLGKYPAVKERRVRKTTLIKCQGRQRKRWEDNIREWTGLDFSNSQRAVENREKWRKLVAKSSVVPKRPSRLRD